MKITSTPSSRRDYSPTPSPKARSWSKKYWKAVNAWWLWECFGWLLSTACLMTIVGLLSRYGGKPLRSWPHSITLNSTLAILSAISKSALMIPVSAGISQLKWTRLKKSRKLLDLQDFDEASRGPLGSMLLIWRGGLITFIGTLVIITGLAFEPFIQQVVAYPSQRVDEGILSSIPRSLLYSSWVFTGQTAPTPTVTAAMKAAIYTGMYTNGTDVPPLCSSGNCTWDTYESVAICGACIDKSHDITVALLPNGSTNSCLMSLPNGAEIISDPEHYYARPVFNLSVGTATSDLDGMDSSIVNFTGIYYENAQAANCTEPQGTARATECNLFWCTNTYQTNVSNNQFQESIVASRPMLSALVDNSSWDRQTFYYKSGNTTFQVGRGVQASMQEYLLLELFIDGNATISEHYNLDYTSDLVSLLYQAAAPTNMQGVLHGRNTDGISDFINHLTRTMTTNVRTTSNGTDMSFDGIAWEQLTYIHVRWAWLVLPLMLDLLAIVFLLCVVVQTISTKTEIWKSSQMITIFRGMSLRDLMDFDTPGGLLEMDEIARGVEVKLEASGRPQEGKRLVKVS